MLFLYKSIALILIVIFLCYPFEAKARVNNIHKVRPYRVSITKIILLTLSKEIIAVYSDDRTKSVNRFCGYNTELLNAD